MHVFNISSLEGQLVILNLICLLYRSDLKPACTHLLVTCRYVAVVEQEKQAWLPGKSLIEE